jgi:hypothetical protein
LAVGSVESEVGAKMKEKEFVEFLKNRGQDEDAIEAAVAGVKEFEQYMAGAGKSLEEAEVSDMKGYLTTLIAKNRNDWDRLVALARYFYISGGSDIYIYFTQILHGREVYPSIAKRLAEVAGEEASEKVFEGIELPPLGSPPEAVPAVTAELVDRLLELGSEVCHKALAGNHHNIPLESFNKHKKWLEEAENFDAFLKRMHDEAVTELDEYAKSGRVWYESVITPETVELVRNNPEMLSAIRDGEYLYMTKFPYAPKDYLEATDPRMKRYYSCHCPLAREAILKDDSDIPLDWCYCSGGFNKLKFDVVFGEPTEVEVLKSVLAGDDICRFRVKIPEGKVG